jgi:hypothetical protein
MAEDARFELAMGGPEHAFPTRLTAIRREPRPSGTCADSFWVAAGERLRIGVIETAIELKARSRHAVSHSFESAARPGAAPAIRQSAATIGLT